MKDDVVENLRKAVNSQAAEIAAKTLEVQDLRKQLELEKKTRNQLRIEMNVMKQ